MRVMRETPRRVETVARLPHPAQHARERLRTRKR
jgi:hypothetical protein